MMHFSKRFLKNGICEIGLLLMCILFISSCSTRTIVPYEAIKGKSFMHKLDLGGKLDFYGATEFQADGTYVPTNKRNKGFYSRSSDGGVEIIWQERGSLIKGKVMKNSTRKFILWTRNDGSTYREFIED